VGIVTNTDSKNYTGTISNTNTTKTNYNGKKTNTN